MSGCPDSLRAHPIMRGCLVVTSLLCLFSCDVGGRDRSAETESVPLFEGVYRVSGTTIEPQADSAREIKGIIVLQRAEEGGYRTSFDLTTSVPSETPEADVSIAIIGQGNGTVNRDGVLSGDARTQLMRASIPGVDARFPFLPRAVAPQSASLTQVRMLSDGRIEVEMQSVVAEGSLDSTTRTSLIGFRIGASVASAPPDVGAAPPAEVTR